MSLTEDTLKKIKDSKIEPKPAWHFMLKRGFLWSAFGVALLVGSLAVSVILFTTTHQGFAFSRELQTGFWSYFVKSLPYVWIVVLLGFLFVALLSYRHTKGGFRHSSLMIWLGSIVLSILLGTLFFYAGVGAYVEYRTDRLLPQYETADEHRMQLFRDRDNLLAGEIIEIKSNSIVLMNDFDGKTWEITIEQAPPFELKLGMRVGLVGDKTGEATFTAEMVRPWDGGPGREGIFGHRVPPSERNMMSPRSSE